MPSDGFKTAAETTKEDQAEAEKTTTRTDRHIEFAALRDRQVALRELQADLTGLPVSHSLISRRLSEKGLNAQRPRKHSHCVFNEKVALC